MTLTHSSYYTEWEQNHSGNWRDGSVVKNIGGSSGFKFHSQHPAHNEREHQFCDLILSQNFNAHFKYNKIFQPLNFRKVIAAGHNTKFKALYHLQYPIGDIEVLIQ